MTSRWDTPAPIRYPDPDIVALDPRFRAPGARPMAAIERIATGCRFTEGPVWFGDGRYLLFSDIPNDTHDALGRGDRRGQRLPPAVGTMPTATRATARAG